MVLALVGVRELRVGLGAFTGPWVRGDSVGVGERAVGVWDGRWWGAGVQKGGGRAARGARELWLGGPLRARGILLRYS